MKLKSVALAVVFVFVALFSATGVKAQTYDRSKTAVDYVGTWNGASCLPDNTTRYEQFVITSDTSGNLTTVLTYINNDGNVEGPATATTTQVNEGALVVNFIATDNPKDKIVFGLAYFSDLSTGYIGGLAAATDENGNIVVNYVPTLFTQSTQDLVSFSKANPGICSTK